MRTNLRSLDIPHIGLVVKIGEHCTAQRLRRAVSDRISCFHQAIRAMRAQPPLGPLIRAKKNSSRTLQAICFGAGSPAPVGDFPRGCDGERRRRSKHAKRCDYVGLGVGLKSIIINSTFKSIYYSNVGGEGGFEYLLGYITTSDGPEPAVAAVTSQLDAVAGRCRSCSVALTGRMPTIAP
jgi:hypothetical protein